MFTIFNAAVCPADETLDEFAQIKEIPKDFLVIAVSGGIAPISPVYKIEIDSQGNGVYSEIAAQERPEGKFSEINKFKLDDTALKLLYASVKANKFFDLKKEYINSAVNDGSFARLIITSSGKTNDVYTQNIKVDGFDQIMITINIVSPEDNQMAYNEILR